MPWASPERIPGAGAILLPAGPSHMIISVAALLTSPFPEFIAGSRPSSSRNPYTLQGDQYIPFGPAAPPYDPASSSPTWTLPDNRPHLI
jgi:hypothetical protein